MISLSEIVVSAVVALLAFGPKQIKQMIPIIAKGIEWFKQLRLNVQNQWTQVLNEQQLMINQKKAEEAEHLSHCKSEER